MNDLDRRVDIEGDRRLSPRGRLAAWVALAAGVVLVAGLGISTLVTRGAEHPTPNEIERKLVPYRQPDPSFARTIYTANKRGIFILASGDQGFCTAFAIRPSVLATNAHCIVAAQRNGGSVVALENESKGSVSFNVVDMHAHPGYRPDDPSSLTPDVGIVNISGEAPLVLPIASQEELAALSAGDEVWLIGFPGRRMDTTAAIATVFSGHIGRVTTAKGRLSSFADTWLVQHRMPATTRGTSGSPIFNDKGHVVAVNAGGYLESDQATVGGYKAEVVKTSPYRFGMRIELLDALLSRGRAGAP